MKFKVVTGHTARNPIARAIARQKVTSLPTTARPRVLMLDDGADDSVFLAGVLQAMGVIAKAADIQWPDKSVLDRDTLADCQVLKGGISALLQNLHKWDGANANAIETGIERAGRINKVLDTKALVEAAEHIGFYIEKVK